VSQVTVTPLEPGLFTVEVRERGRTTTHRVRVPESMVADLELGAIDPELLVRESFAFLLEREPATSILREFALTDIGRYFPEYSAEIRRRVTGAG
jgi:hypothetical protein